MPERFEIQSVRAAEPGQRFLGQVTFAFVPSEAFPLKVTRDYQNKAQEWKTAEVAEVHGATRVIVKNAFVKESRNHEMYVQVQGVDVPWEISRAVGDAAYAIIEAKHQQRTLEQSGAA